MMTQILQIQDARTAYASKVASLEALEEDRVLLSIDVKYADGLLESSEEFVLSIDNAVKMRIWLDQFLMNRT